MKDLFIIGAGGFAKEVYLLAKDCNFIINSFIDTQSGSLLNLPIHTEDEINLSNQNVAIAVGAPHIRKKIVNNLIKKFHNINFVNLIHPTSISMMGFSYFNENHVRLGIGNIVSANCIITSNIEFKNFCQLNLSTTIGHDTNLGNFFTTAPGVHISGNNNISDEVYFGTNSSSIEKINITNNVIIGAGACVTKDILEEGTYVGVPAKKIMR